MPARLRQLLAGNLRATDLHNSKLAVAAYRLVRRAFGRVGLQVVARTFYSPIPDLRTVPDTAWTVAGELPGIDFDLERQLAFLEDELGPALAEFRPSPRVAGNPTYGRVDSDVLYAMIRTLKPTRVIELGSGYSSLVAAQACRRNAADGNAARYTAYDPFPGVASPPPPGLDELVPMRAQDVPAETFAELGANDVLVVDTTHTVKVGGDVNRIVLDVLPRLAPGVAVHFHDVFLPWEYPRAWLDDYGLYWAEQYLLQAFLALNHDYEILCALHAVYRAHPERVTALMTPFESGPAPGAFWIRRT